MQKPSVCSVIISLILAERASSNNVLAPIRRGHKLASMIWLAVVDNLEENHHTFCLLKRLAREGDVFLPYPYTRSVRVKWRVFEKFLLIFVIASTMQIIMICWHVLKVGHSQSK
ncbi:unnamed protein product [Lathyrus oleraceus]|uniref:Uncharacterized protein n=1 Tax=Pisum sativum TaxID=3888 RepID=A0A9D4VZC7_PEA|nr:hypothetical protein KIW84_076866 [Pisum sativum]